MNPKIQTIVEHFLQHLQKRELYEIAELFSDSLDWFIPGDVSKAPWLGKRSTKEEVSDFFSMLWKNTEPISAEIYTTLYNMDNCIIAGEFKTKMVQTNKIVQSPFFIHITIENGLIKRYRLLEDSYAVSLSLDS